MNENEVLGIYLFSHRTQESRVLKDILQFLKTNSPVKDHSFSYVEATTSLHKDLTLWENIQIELGVKNWTEFQHSIGSKYSSLLALIKDYDLPAHKAQKWECLIISFLKGYLRPTKNLIINMDEEILSPILIQQLKKHILETSKTKRIILSSKKSPLWLDCAHSIVTKSDEIFVVEKLNFENLKKNWAA